MQQTVAEVNPETTKYKWSMKIMRRIRDCDSKKGISNAAGEDRQNRNSEVKFQVQFI